MEMINDQNYCLVTYFMEVSRPHYFLSSFYTKYNNQQLFSLGTEGVNRLSGGRLFPSCLVYFLYLSRICPRLETKMIWKCEIFLYCPLETFACHVFLLLAMAFIYSFFHVHVERPIPTLPLFNTLLGGKLIVISQIFELIYFFILTNKHVTIKRELHHHQRL